MESKVYFSTPQGTLFLSPFHPPIAHIPPLLAEFTPSLSSLSHACFACLFGSLPTTLLLHARAAPSPRHGPITPPARSRSRPGHAPCGSHGHVPRSHHGPGSHSAAHITAHTTPHMVTITPGTDAVTSPPRPGPHTLSTTLAQPMLPSHQAHGCSLATPTARPPAAATYPESMTCSEARRLRATIRPARPEPATRQGDHPPPYISPGFVAYWPSRGSYSGFVAYWPFRLSLLGTGPRSRGTLSKDTIREVGGS